MRQRQPDAEAGSTTTEGFIMTVTFANLDTDGDKHSFDHGQLTVVTLEGTMLARGVFNPGWKWSNDVQPHAHTPSCQARHTGIVLSGRFRIRTDDGTEAEFGPGDAHVVAPGHDAWVVGNEQCVIIDIGPAPADGVPVDAVMAYFEAFNRANVDDILTLFTQDATVMADGVPTASGSSQLRTTYEQFFAAFTVTEDVTLDRVETGSDLAVVRTHSFGTITPTGGEPAPLALRELFALRRTADGWRINEYAFNADPSH
jgi:uncharacterized protein (TIGR02246 family)